MSLLILASSSASRATLLARTGLSFTQISPNIDETAQQGESPLQLVSRLSRQKAEVISAQHPESVVIAGDQILATQGKILGKPHDYHAATEQLTLCSGKQATFFTGICVQQGEQQLLDVVTTQIAFRHLSPQDIHHYLTLDTPYECAGSLRFEGAAPWLLTQVSSPDPSAITGLPLIALRNLLSTLNYPVITTNE